MTCYIILGFIKPIPLLIPILGILGVIIVLLLLKIYLIIKGVL